MTPSRGRESLAGPEPAASYLVQGDDPSLVGEALGQLVGELVGDEDRGLVVEHHGGEDIDVAAVVNACRTPPFLATRRVVVVREAGRLGAEQAAPLVDYLEDPLPTTVLVLVAGGGTLPPRLGAAVKRAGRALETGAGTGRARTRWLVDRLSSAPVRLDSAAAQELGEHVGEDVGRLASVLEVLAAAYGEGAEVGHEQLEPFLGEAGAVPPWELTDAIDRGDTPVALGLLHRLVGAGERHPLVVMSVLHRHYAAMLRLDGAAVSSDAEAADLLGSRSTFTAGKALAQSRRLGSAGVARAIELLAAADLDLRGETGWAPELVVEVLVARLSRLTRQRVPAGSTSRRSRR